MHSRLPIWLGTGTEANVKLTARSRRRLAPARLRAAADADAAALARGRLSARRRRQGLGRLRDQARAEVAITDDVRGALARMKPRVALYVGGMGHRDKNFHKEMMIRRGFGEAAQRIQELYLARRKDEAVAAVPDEFCDEMSLVGPGNASASAIAPGPTPASPG